MEVANIRFTPKSGPLLGRSRQFTFAGSVCEEHAMSNGAAAKGKHSPAGKGNIFRFWRYRLTTT
jgi:hypothetical protein